TVAALTPERLEKMGRTTTLIGDLFEREPLFAAIFAHTPERQSIRPFPRPTFHHIAGKIEVRRRHYLHPTRQHHSPATKCLPPSPHPMRRREPKRRGCQREAGALNGDAMLLPSEGRVGDVRVTMHRLPGVTRTYHQPTATYRAA